MERKRTGHQANLTDQKPLHIHYSETLSGINFRLKTYYISLATTLRYKHDTNNKLQYTLSVHALFFDFDTSLLRAR
jgi:hypothetical protein